MKTKFKIVTAGLLMLASSIFTGCKDDDDTKISKPDLEFVAITLTTSGTTAITTTSQLTVFNAQDVRTPLRTISLTGLSTGEYLLAIDYRPATGQLYGLGSTGRVYVINMPTGPAATTGVLGAATLVGAGPITPAISGTIAGFDFNPQADRLRIITSAGQNYRINPETGEVSSDVAINGGDSPAISASAYTNNYSGADTTFLYNLDVVSQKLYIQPRPNTGALTEVGSLDLPESSGNAAFDISDNGTALAIIKNGAGTALYQINLETGKASSLGSIYNTATSAATSYAGIAIVPQPVAYAVDESNNLMIFNPLNTTSAPILKRISRMDPGENILGIDFRPATRQLYALGSNSNVYTVNIGNGQLTKVSSFLPLLSGTSFGFDFNPAADLIRIVSNTGQNLRYSPVTGLASIDPPLIAGTEITAAAYTSNAIGATAATVLYVIDVTGDKDKLYTQNATTGVLTSVGPAGLKLGANITGANGFDIGSASGTAYGLFTTTDGASRIYTVNLAPANTATSVVTLGAEFPVAVRGFTIGLGF